MRTAWLERNWTLWLLSCLLCACTPAPRSAEPPPRAESPRATAPHSAQPTAQPAAQEQRASSAIPFVPAEAADALPWLEAPARVVAAPEATALVTAPLSARIVRLRIRPGQRVEAGEPLIDVVMPELLRAAGALVAANLRIASHVEHRARVSGLLAQGLARADELLELELALANARGDRESARATLRAAGEPDARASAILHGDGVVSLRAPISGMVVSLSAQHGEIREPALPLAALAGVAAVQVEARFALEPSQSMRFEWVERGRSVPLSLEAVSPQRGAGDGSRVAWLRPTAGEQLSPGSLGRVRIVPPSGWSVVPVGALYASDGGHHVLRERDGQREEWPVTLVARSESEAIVRGLVPGTRVAADSSKQAP